MSLIQPHPLISIIIPVYNTAEYLPRCIESVLAQTYKSLEILIIDDGSVDGSEKICDGFAEKDKRIKVIHQPNAGVSAARNAGLDLARGEWIGFVDSDDWIEPVMFERLLNTAVANGKDISVCGYYKHHADGNLEKQSHPEIPAVVFREEALEYMLHRCYFEGYMVNKLFKNELFNGNEKVRLNEDIFFCEDLNLMVRLFLNSNSIAYIPEALYHYCLRKGNATNTFNKRRLTELVAREHIIQLVSPVSKKLTVLAKFYYVEAVVGLLYLAARCENDKTYLPVLRKNAWRYGATFLLSKESSLKMRIRSTLIICFPLLSYHIWSVIKQRFKVSWWNREIRGNKI